MHLREAFIRKRYRMLLAYDIRLLDETRPVSFKVASSSHDTDRTHHQSTLFSRQSEQNLSVSPRCNPYYDRYHKNHPLIGVAFYCVSVI